MRYDAPAGAIPLQQQVNQTHMAAPEASHHPRFAVDRACGRVDARHPVKIRAGEDQMAVPGQDGVDPLDTGKGNRRVLRPLDRVRVAHTRMAQRHDDICAFLADLWHPGLGRRHDVPRGHVAFKVLGVPVHDLRRHETDDPDADRMRRSRAIGQRPVQDHIGRQQRLVLARGGPGRLGHIGRDDGEVRPRDRVHQESQAIVELMVAQRGPVKSQRVHRRDDRVHLSLIHAPLIGDIVAHRVALQEIAIVEKDGVRRFRPDRRNQAGRA